MLHSSYGVTSGGPAPAQPSGPVGALGAWPGGTMASMRAVVYTRSGGSDVLEVVDRPVPEPGHGEVLVRVVLSGVNPTDWKRRSNGELPDEGWQIPNQDGAGVIEAVGPGVDQGRIGERVWLWEVAYQRPWGTAAE